MKMEPVPEKIGKYKIVSEIAKGGMGTVYKAIHPSLRRYVIIKKLTIRGNAAIRERFVREAKILLDLHNSNIVHLYDYFVESSYHYIVLEYVDGMSLDKFLKPRKKLSNQMTMLIFRDVCMALAYAHENGIVHRDIKPGNILMSRRGEIKLADFGIASADEFSETELTQAGVTLGTPSYMPPEQFSDSKSVDKRADIYAMGIMLYELTTGQKPYPGSFSPETITQIQKGKYIPPEKIEKNIAPVIRRLIKKMTRPNPKRRYQDISQVLKVINSYLKKYEVEEIRNALAQCIAKIDTPEPEYQERNKFLFKTLKIAGILCCIFCSLFFCWNKGFIHQTILRPWYTPVSLTMELPTTATQDSDLPIRAFFYENDNKTIPEIEDARRVFIHDKNTSNKKNIRYFTKDVFLKPGNYRIKVVTGSYIWWQSISVKKEDKVVNLRFLKNATRPLKLKAEAFDGIKDIPITSSASFFVHLNNNWLPLSEVNPDQLISGKIYSFKVSADGYKTEYFTLRIEWYQDELFLNALLFPEEKQ